MEYKCKNCKHYDGERGYCLVRAAYPNIKQITKGYIVKQPDDKACIYYEEVKPHTTKVACFL